MSDTPNKPPWKRPNPKTKAGKPARKLTGPAKAAARARARRAGRPYPNLIDNMAAARKKKKKTTRRSKR